MLIYGLKGFNVTEIIDFTTLTTVMAELKGFSCALACILGDLAQTERKKILQEISNTPIILPSPPSPPASSLEKHGVLLLFLGQKHARMYVSVE